MNAKDDFLTWVTELELEDMEILKEQKRLAREAKLLLQASLEASDEDGNEDDAEEEVKEEEEEEEDYDLPKFRPWKSLPIILV